MPPLTSPLELADHSALPAVYPAADVAAPLDVVKTKASHTGGVGLHNPTGAARRERRIHSLEGHTWPATPLRARAVWRRALSISPYRRGERSSSDFSQKPL
jgi:hypothetical protein